MALRIFPDFPQEPEKSNLPHPTPRHSLKEEGVEAQLPIDNIESIFAFLDIHSLFQMQQLSRGWNQIASEEILRKLAPRDYAELKGNEPKDDEPKGDEPKSNAPIWSDALRNVVKLYGNKGIKTYEKGFENIFSMDSAQQAYFWYLSSRTLYNMTPNRYQFQCYSLKNQPPLNQRSLNLFFLYRFQAMCSGVRQPVTSNEMTKHAKQVLETRKPRVLDLFLELAAHCNQLDYVKHCVLNYSKDLDTKNVFDGLKEACRVGNKDIAELLLPLEQIDKIGREIVETEALIEATRNGHYFSILKNAKPFAAPRPKLYAISEEASAAQIACRNGNYQAVTHFF